MALRGLDAGSPEAAMTDVSWPARMQRLRAGPVLEVAPEAEVWLDGGHNPHCARAILETLQTLPERPTHMIAGLLKTKDARGYFAPLAEAVASVQTVSIPGQSATLSAIETADAARAAGLDADPADSVGAAVSRIARSEPRARILIGGSLYLAGTILKDHH